MAYKDYVKEGKPSSEIILTGEDEPVLTIDGYTLAKGVDYEVSYCNNTWIGTAEVIFKGIGAYTGTVKKTFKITANLADETDAAKIVIGDQKHTGSAVKVKPIVTYYGTALKEGTHFTVAGYENNTEITKETEATVKISGNEENGFTGTCTATFKIAADTKALQISGMEESYFYRGESITPEVVVKSGEATLAASEYEVVYGENLHVGTGTIAVVGKGKYAGCANMVEFQILPLKMETLTVTGADAKPLTDKEYTGQPILPEILLEAEIGSKKYKLPTGDYSVSVKDSGDNTNVGIVTLEIKGGTNITGSRDVTFNIVPKSLAKPETGKDNISVKVTWDDGYVYDGTAKTPDVVVTYQYGDGETEISTLTKDTDYTLTYSDNTSAGTAKVIVTGKENYTGSRTETFTIKQQDFSDVAIVNLPGGTSYVYMGTKVEPKVSVSANGVTLTQDTDYVLSYENNTTCGTATVTVTGKGNFSGTIKGNFTIVEHNIATSSDIKIGNDGKIPNQGYTGAPIVPNISISCGSYKLKAGVDYELSCSDNTDMGTATIIIKGIGGFTGSKELKFNIKTNIAKVLVEGLKDTYSYTGKQLTEADLAISKVTLGATPLNKDTDYTISFADDCDATNVGKHTVIVNGVGEYGGTAEFPVTITPKNIQDDDVELQGFSENPPYTGLVTTQNISLYWRGKDITLLKDKDYEVVYTPSGELGNFVMTITGKGNYVGTIEKKYRVETVPVDSLEINDISSVYTYTGAEIVPEPTLLHDSYKLKKNVDYTLTYSDNTEVGTAKVTITGIGACCTGTKDITFKIVQKSINKLQAGTIAAQIYTGKDIVPGVTLTDEKKILAENTDYTLLYKKNRKTGTGSVVITGKGNYTSTRTIPFAIRPSGVESMMVTGASQTTASLSWKSEGAVTGFEIYRKTAGGKWQLVGGTGESTYTDTKLSSGTTYIYKLRSYVIEEEQTYYGEFSPEFVGTTME